MQSNQQNTSSSVEDAKQVAQRLLRKYDRSNRGSLAQQDVGNILRDIYQDAHLNYNVSSSDEASYFRILDCNKDNQISLSDMEQVCIKYLCGYNQEVRTSHVHGATESKKHAHHTTTSYGKPSTTTYQSYSKPVERRYEPAQQSSNTYQTQTRTYVTSNNNNNVRTSYTTQQYQQGGSNTTQYRRYEPEQRTVSYQTSTQQQQQHQHHDACGNDEYHHHDIQNFYDTVNVRGSYLKHETEQKEPQHIKAGQYKKNNIPQGNSKYNSANLFSMQGQQSGMHNHSKLQALQQKFSCKHAHEFGMREGPRFRQILQQCQQRRQKFTDPEFPPNNNSLSRIGEWFDGEPIPYTDWIRPDQHFKGGYELYQGGIMPGDIKQGELGDCYFQCAIAALAEWPERIQRIFSTDKKNEWGVYSCWFVFNGEEVEVVVDDNLWYNARGGYIVSMQSNGPEIWPQIIEKCWAKLNKDYFCIDGGFARDALHDLTGAPVIHYRIAEQHNWDSQKELLWQQLLNGEKSDFVMAASTYAEDPTGEMHGDSDARDGIFYMHAYSILAAYEANVGGRKVKLVKFRNPHGEGEWSGPFGDRDPVWRTMAQSEKDRLGYADDDDGEFFMEYDRLRTYFEDVQVCQYRDHYQYSGFRVDTTGEREHYFKVDISEAGYYYFQVNQRARAEFGEESKYTYTRATVVVGNPNGQLISAAQAKQKNVCSYRSQQQPKQIQPGTYYVMAKVLFDFHQKSENVRKFGFGVYGKCKANIQEIQAGQVPQNLIQKLNNPGPQILEILPSFVI